MASSEDYRDYVLEQLNLLETITNRPMMGEFLLYYNQILFGGIYDDRLLIKKTKTNDKFQLDEQSPYEGTKPMYFIENMEDREWLKSVVLETCKGLKSKKKK